ncbi:hypothetical protein J1N35_037040 [Gossypium stocksii]|uniref:RNase H type-1 domain-containing protein n=1 Tax=Gossypium stocksii TaxID=47602 RepID=A0A9D3UJF7_9ROSI|nr:hypothetical protein J1N35_037040 [Gossypium stocksii]
MKQSMEQQILVQNAAIQASDQQIFEQEEQSTTNLKGDGGLSEYCSPNLSRSDAKSNTKIFGALHIESDCSNAIRWFKQPQSAPSFIQSIILACLRQCSGINFDFKLIPREANSVADQLAKSGIGQVEDLLVVTAL